MFVPAESLRGFAGITVADGVLHHLADLAVDCFHGIKFGNGLGPQSLGGLRAKNGLGSLGPCSTMFQPQEVGVNIDCSTS